MTAANPPTSWSTSTRNHERWNQRRDVQFFDKSERVFEAAPERWIRRHIYDRKHYYGGCFLTSLHPRAEAEDTPRTPPLPSSWRTWTSLRFATSTRVPKSVSKR